MAANRALAISGYGPSAEVFSARGPLASHPRLALAVLDLAGLAVVLAAFAGQEDPDVLFHVVWIILCVQAFLFGGYVGAARIVVAASAITLYWLLAIQGARPLGTQLAAMDLEEWPLMVVIVSIVATLAERARQARTRYAAMYREARDRLVTAQEDERRQLAANLHDGVGQTLTALNLTLDATNHRLARSATPADPVRMTAARARELGDLALEDVRRVALRLRPVSLESVGLVAAIRRLAEAPGPTLRVTAAAQLARPGLLPPADEDEVFRIVQESVGNAMRHARARTIDVTIAPIGGRLQIDIVDDGVGFHPAAIDHAGLGLDTMRERTEGLGGQLLVRSRPGHGTQVRLRVPFAGATEEGVTTTARAQAAGDAAGVVSR